MRDDVNDISDRLSDSGSVPEKTCDRLEEDVGLDRLHG